MKKFTIFFSFLLIFTFFFVGSTYAAETELPEFPKPFSGLVHKYYSFTNFDGSKILYAFSINKGSSYEPKLKAYKYDDTMLSIENTDTMNATYVKYKLIDGAWVKDGSSILLAVGNTINLSMTEQFEILYASDNIYMSRSSDEVFFPLPPTVTPTLEEVLAEETLATQEKIIQTMKIILLCGVGCLALLIGLNLFGKVFRIFQVK